MIRRTLILCLSLCLLDSCKENVAGGTSEHENVVQVQRLAPVGDSVLAVVLDSRGLPIPYAVVQAVERRNWAARTENGERVVRDSAFIADKDGLFSVDYARCANVGLQVRVPGKGLGYVPCARVQSVLKIEVGKPQKFFGKATANQWVAVYGTGFFTRSDKRGHWHLPLPGNLRREDIVRMENGNWHLLNERSGRIVVENFSDASSSFTLLHRFNGGSRWWASFDSDSSGDSTANLAAHRVFADARHGNALHINLVDASGGKAMVGFDWGRERTYPDLERVYRDLSSVDTLFLSARGKGTVRVQFVCRAADLLKNTVFETKIALDSSWTDYALPIESFQVADGSTLDDGFSWEEVNRHCKATVFYADGPADLWLDDIAIHGALLKDIE